MTALLSTLLTSLDARLDRAVPAAVRARSELQHQRGRAVLAIASFVAPLGVVFGVLYHAVLGTHLFGLISDLYTLVFMGAWWLVARQGQVRQAAQLIAGGTVACLIAALCLSGGYSSPFLPSLVVGLVFIASLHGIRATVLWGALLLGLFVAMAGLHAAGVVVPDLLGDAGARWVPLLALPGSLFVVGIATTIDRSVQRRARLEAEQSSQERARALAQAEQANRAREAVFATVSHDLRTPLSALVGSLELLQLQRDLPDAAREHLHRMARSSDTLLDLVNEVLDWTRIEAGVLDLQRDEYDIIEIVEDIHQMLQDRAARQGLSLRLQVFGRHAVADTDPRRLRQVLLNLVGNALTYTREGHVDLVVRTIEDRVLIEVSDSGPGIPAAALPTLFEPFTRADDHVQLRGTGLGLAICRRVVQALGGTLTVESQVGLGTRFVVGLPGAGIDTLVPVEERTAQRDAAAPDTGLVNH